MDKKIEIQSVAPVKYGWSFVICLTIELLCVVSLYSFLMPNASRIDSFLNTSLSESPYVIICTLLLAALNPVTLWLAGRLGAYKAGAICWNQKKSSCMLEINDGTLKCKYESRTFRCTFDEIKRISYTGFSMPLFRQYEDTVIIPLSQDPRYAITSRAYHHKVDMRDRVVSTDANGKPRKFHCLKVQTVFNEKMVAFIPVTPFLSQQTAAYAGNLESFVKYILSLELPCFTVRNIRHGVLLKNNRQRSV